MQELQADTAATILIGPFVDKGDGVTPEEGITLAGADSAELMKHDGTTFVDLTSDSRTFTHKEKGMYTLALGTGDTDTEGRLTVFISDESVCLPVWKDFMVISQATWASKYTAKASGYMDVDVTAISTSATAADNVESVFTGAGDTGDVDLVARSLKLNNDADVALEILSSDDSAIKAVSSASGKHGMELAATAANGDGLNAIGNTTGDGFHLEGGATGHGISTQGGATSGQGIFAAGAVDGSGILARGGSSSGAGIKAEAKANDDAGMELVKHGTGKDIDADEIDNIPTVAEINAEVVDALDTDTYAEPASVPAATSSLKDKICWLFTLARNKITQTSSTQTLRNDTDAASIGTATVSDDGTTATRDEWS